MITKNKVTLADHLNLKELPLATTPGGTAFALKCLHPSEHTIKAARCPSGNANSVALCADAIHTIPSTAANAQLLVVQTQNVLCPCAVYYTSGGVTQYWDFFNSAFGGYVVANPTAAQITTFMRNNMVGHIERYRINAQSVTIELIAPALSDQGTITACQYESSPMTSTRLYQDTATSYYVGPDVTYMNTPPDPSTWLLGTASYTAKAREGVYQPLRLNKPGRWHDFNDLTCFFEETATGNGVLYPPEHISLVGNLRFPYCVNRSAVTSFSDIDLSPKLCGTNVGVINMEGMAANVSIRVRVRQVVEITATPGSRYAPLLERPLPPDFTALRMVSEISARMADGYPASYNDIGKLRDIIMGIGKKIAPYVEPALSAISLVPGPIGTVGKVASMAAPVVKQAVGVIKEARKTRKQQKKAAAAAQQQPQPKKKN